LSPEDQGKFTLADLITEVFGEEGFEDGVTETARRVYEYWKEYRPSEKLGFSVTTFEASVNQLIVVKGIEFQSLCAHHLLPILGVAHIGYLPNALMIGVSKIPRIVDHFARRPQTQEVLTSQIASFLKHKLEAQGVAVVIEATHSCMAARGVRKHNGKMITSEMRGIFLTSSSARSEFLEMIR
jgi:GTP cyclohydrolase I